MNSPNTYIDLIYKNLSNQISADENHILQVWIQNDPQNLKIYEEYKKTWELSQHYDFEIESINLDLEWAKQNSKISPVKPVKKIETNRTSRFVWLKIAASILFVIVTGTLLFNIFSVKEISLSAENSILENKLPDGSLISLNYNSKLTYNKTYNKTNRIVQLNGEAFFDVNPNKEKPFIVEVDDLMVEAVGTSFNIKQIDENNTIEIHVSSGIVQLYNPDNPADHLLLYANESATYNPETKKITKMTIPDANYLSWKTKMFNFDNSSFEYIVNTLKRCYNADIQLLNPDLKFCSVTVSFRNQSLESALKVLEATLDIKIEKKDNTFEISGNGCSNPAVE